MYCPNCGSNNQAEVKFCTRCGTNLVVVSDALNGRPRAPGHLDERLAKVIEDYYKGRRDAITGMVLLPAAVKAMALLTLLGMPPLVSFFMICWMLFWGVGALAGGLGKWISARGEMRALGYQPPKGKLARSVERLLTRSSVERSTTTNKYSTGPVSAPISVPSSVTEQTTRTLEEHARQTRPTES